MKKLLLAAVAGVALPAMQASASLLVYEPFDYTAGEAIGGQTNPYTAEHVNPADPPNTLPATWNDAGTATPPVHDVLAGSLTGPAGFPASVGNSGQTRNADNTQFERLNLPDDYGVNTTLYYSLLLNIPSINGLTTLNTNLNANNDLLIGFNNTLGAGARPSNWAGELVIRLGSVADTYNLGIRASNTPGGTNPGHTYWTGDIATGGTHLIVVRYAQGPTDSSGADDENALWLDPSSANFGVTEGSVPAPDGSSQGTINAASPTNNFARSLIIGAGIAAGATPDLNVLDEIRVGTTWADVTAVPEPASLAMFALGGLGLLARRRRA